MVISFRAPLDVIYATMVEHRNADGKQGDYVTSRTSEGDQQLQRDTGFSENLVSRAFE